jgi:two-component system OmpR family response regulator
MRILLVEDDEMIGEVMRDALKDASYAVDWVNHGQAAITTFDCQAYDLILLDRGLPGKEGMDILKYIRSKNKNIPVLMVTARTNLEDRLQGLDNGADDYILKPFDMAELLARVRAVARRKGGGGSSLLSNGVVSLDLTTREASTETTPAVQLSNREFALLQALLIRPGAILSRADIENRLYGWGEEVESNAVEFLIHSLRRKLGTHVIKNVRGAGWMVLKNV